MYLIGALTGVFALAEKSIHGQTKLSSLGVGCADLLNLFYVPLFGDFWIQTGGARIAGAVFPINDPSWS